jgi:hypothetical protein
VQSNDLEVVATHPHQEGVSRIGEDAARAIRQNDSKTQHLRGQIVNSIQ